MTEVQEVATSSAVPTVNHERLNTENLLFYEEAHKAKYSCDVIRKKVQELLATKEFTQTEFIKKVRML